ncbi:alpha/beta fold hydrolase [Neobacillus sp. NRS-1170]|uniref:alpha/beta fold hydrolase n=1 Tax=Neobacillus sp. NRS-1170 TaxID=3233898 RepID=UPI003D28471D
MLTNILKNTIPSYDLEKERDRWNQFLTIRNQPKPKINQTPKQAVWKKNKATLWYYPAVEKKYDIPIFFVFSLMNRAYILDLAPGTSTIESLVNEGYDVYLLDWGIPGHEDKDLNLEDYVENYIKKGVQRALRHSGAKEISLVGYCLGGVLASLYASIAEEPIKNLVAITIPIDYSVSVAPDSWSKAFKNGSLNLDRFIDVNGLVPAKFIETMVKGIVGPIAFTSKVSLLNNAHNKGFVEKWRLMDHWLYDQIPVSGGAFRQLFNDIVKDNKIVKGEFTVHGKNADLSNIKANLLVITSKNDTLVREEQTRPIMELVSSEDKTYQLLEAGHINIALTGKLAGELIPWLATRSDLRQG